MTIQTDLLIKHAEGHDPQTWMRAYDQVCELLVGSLGIAREKLSPDMRLDENLLLDSLDLLDFSLVLSDQYQIELGLDALRLADTVGDVTSLLAAAEQDRRARAQ